MMTQREAVQFINSLDDDQFEELLCNTGACDLGELVTELCTRGE